MPKLSGEVVSVRRPFVRYAEEDWNVEQRMMTNAEFHAKLDELKNLPVETEWLGFKEAKSNFDLQGVGFGVSPRDSKSVAFIRPRCNQIARLRPDQHLRQSTPMDGLDEALPSWASCAVSFRKPSMAFLP